MIGKGRRFRQQLAREQAPVAVGPKASGQDPLKQRLCWTTHCGRNWQNSKLPHSMLFRPSFANNGQNAREAAAFWRRVSRQKSRRPAGIAGSLVFTRLLWRQDACPREQRALGSITRAGGLEGLEGLEGAWRNAQ